MVCFYESVGVLNKTVVLSSDCYVCRVIQLSKVIFD